MNDTVITGAAVGFLVWAACLAVITASMFDGEVKASKAGLSIVAFIGIGAAIGWLVS